MLVAAAQHLMLPDKSLSFSPPEPEIFLISAAVGLKLAVNAADVWFLNPQIQIYVSKWAQG